MSFSFFKTQNNVKTCLHFSYRRKMKKHKFLFFIFKKMKNDFLTFIFHFFLKFKMICLRSEVIFIFQNRQKMNDLRPTHLPAIFITRSLHFTRFCINFKCTKSQSKTYFERFAILDLSLLNESERYYDHKELWVIVKNFGVTHSPRQKQEII